jgi:phosphatidylglycerophosphate synthase
MDKGRKIDSEDENPIDDVLIKCCKSLSEIIHEKFPSTTPNMITTVGLIFGLSSIYCIYKEKYILGFFLFWISYFFDCLDGFYARKYNMITKFGDYYDHIRDLIIGVSVIILIFIKLKGENLRILYTMIILTSLYAFLAHIGCQEKNSNHKEHNDCLSLFEGLCKKTKWIEITKYLGNGTFILIISAFIIFLELRAHVNGAI